MHQETTNTTTGPPATTALADLDEVITELGVPPPLPCIAADEQDPELALLDSWILAMSSGAHP